MCFQKIISSSALWLGWESACLFLSNPWVPGPARYTMDMIIQCNSCTQELEAEESEVWGYHQLHACLGLREILVENYCSYMK